MKSVTTKVLTFISKLIPQNIYPRIIQRDVICFFYHAVSDAELPHIRFLYPVVPVSEFVAALDYLRKNYQFISYSQLHDHHAKGKSLPQNAVHLSFDDGLAECYSVVRPILSDYQIPCTFFVTIKWLDNENFFYRHLISLCVDQAFRLEPTAQNRLFDWMRLNHKFQIADMNGFREWITSIRNRDDQKLTDVSKFLGIDESNYLSANKPYMTSEQIQEMYSDGFTIGAHGITHRKLGFIPETEMELEILESCQTIQAITGQDIVPFSFPQSAGNVDRSRLGDILDRYPFIGLMFDTKDLRLDKKFLINRVWAERPLTPQRELQPLTKIIENAYQDAFVDGIISSLSRRKLP
jgi:peptidoglycan/xylan/chitin deacetylase (PgdA/CDA1 family)